LLSVALKQRFIPVLTLLCHIRRMTIQAKRGEIPAGILCPVCPHAVHPGHSPEASLTNVCMRGGFGEGPPGYNDPRSRDLP